MRGSYTNYLIRTSRLTDAVEKAKDRHKEACELRRAKAMNTLKEKVNTPWETEGDHLSKTQPEIGQ